MSTKTQWVGPDRLLGNWLTRLWSESFKQLEVHDSEGKLADLIADENPDSAAIPNQIEILADGKPQTTIEDLVALSLEDIQAQLNAHIQSILSRCSATAVTIALRSYFIYESDLIQDISDRAELLLRYERAPIQAEAPAVNPLQSVLANIVPPSQPAERRIRPLPPPPEPEIDIRTIEEHVKDQPLLGMLIRFLVLGYERRIAELLERFEDSEQRALDATNRMMGLVTVLVTGTQQEKQSALEQAKLLTERLAGAQSETTNMLLEMERSRSNAQVLAARQARADEQKQREALDAERRSLQALVEQLRKERDDAKEEARKVQTSGGKRKGDDRVLDLVETAIGQQLSDGKKKDEGGGGGGFDMTALNDPEKLKQVLAFAVQSNRGSVVTALRNFAVANPHAGGDMIEALSSGVEQRLAAEDEKKDKGEGK